jgi:PAS domain-containing protein
MPARLATTAASIGVVLGATLPARVGGQAAPAVGAVAITDVLRDANGDAVPDRLGERVTIRGVVTAPPRIAREPLEFAVVQDRRGAIRLLAPMNGPLAGLRPGDAIEATGTLAQFRGAEELHVERLVRNGAAPVPVPRDVMVGDLRGEDHAGRLVRVSGTIRVRTDEDGETTYEIGDRSGRIALHLPPRILGAPGMREHLARGAVAAVAGIAGQSDPAPPFTDGYRLAPRDAADLAFTPAPPYRALAAAAALAGVAALLLSSWLRRRGAERRAAELQRLTAELRRSEAALRAGEEHYRLLFEASPRPMWVYDAETLAFLAVNEAAERQYGYARAEFLAMTLRDIRPPEDVPALERAVAAAPDGHTP